MDKNKTYTTDQWLSVGEVGHVYQNCLENFLKTIPVSLPPSAAYPCDIWKPGFPDLAMG